MIKYCLDQWNRNQSLLRKQLETDTSLNECGYEYLVKLVTKYILGNDWDAEHITAVNNGGYQGILLFLIPRNTYSPSEYDYFMTYVNYGSCAYCDTLQAIQDYKCNDDPITEEQICGFMKLCKDLVTNMIRPYNIGWRSHPDFNPVEFDE